jgi:hypothetical protein
MSEIKRTITKDIRAEFQGGSAEWKLFKADVFLANVVSTVWGFAIRDIPADAVLTADELHKIAQFLELRDSDE